MDYLKKHIDVFLSLQLEDIVRSGQNDLELEFNNWANNVEEFINLSSLNLRQNLFILKSKYTNWPWIT